MKLIILFILTVPILMQAQDLKKHQWKHRIILVSSADFDNKKAQQQLQLLQDELTGLQDRKLKIYHITNQGYSTDFGEEIIVSKSSNTENNSFSVSLIGLDGTEKDSFNSPQIATVFFRLIDQMPMRRSEIKNRD